jgi:hypothetical protein
MVPHLLTDGGNQSCPEFWAITGDPRYPGYETSTIASEPSVERVVENILSGGGRIGTHILL